MKFGEYLKEKRSEKNMKAKTAAEILKISPAYLSSLENGSRSAPSYELLERVADVLELDTDDRYLLYDLAAESKSPSELSRDLTGYIYQNPQIRLMLRYAMKCRLTEKEWTVILNFVNMNYKY